MHNQRVDKTTLFDTDQDNSRLEVNNTLTPASLLLLKNTGCFFSPHVQTNGSTADVSVFFLLSVHRRSWRPAWAAGSSLVSPPRAGGCCYCPTRKPHRFQTPRGPRQSECYLDWHRCESSLMPSDIPGIKGRSRHVYSLWNNHLCLMLFL